MYVMVEIIVTICYKVVCMYVMGLRFRSQSVTMMKKRTKGVSTVEKKRILLDLFHFPFCLGGVSWVLFCLGMINWYMLLIQRVQ